MSALNLFPKTRNLATELNMKRFAQDSVAIGPHHFSKSPLSRLLVGMTLLESMDDHTLSIHNSNESNADSFAGFLPPHTTAAYRRKFFSRSLSEEEYYAGFSEGQGFDERLDPFFEELSRFRDRAGASALELLSRAFPQFPLFSGPLMEGALRRDPRAFGGVYPESENLSGALRHARMILEYMNRSVPSEGVSSFLSSLEGPWPSPPGAGTTLRKTYRFISAVEEGSLPALIKSIAELRDAIAVEKEELELRKAERAKKASAKADAKMAFKEILMSVGESSKLLRLLELSGEKAQFSSNDNYAEYKDLVGDPGVMSGMSRIFEGISSIEPSGSIARDLRKYRGAKCGMLSRLDLMRFWGGEIGREELESRLARGGWEVKEIDENSAKIVRTAVNATETLQRERIGASLASHTLKMQKIRNGMLLSLRARYEHAMRCAGKEAWPSAQLRPIER